MADGHSRPGGYDERRQDADGKPGSTSPSRRAEPLCTARLSGTRWLAVAGEVS
jgi:hypothetical protein